MVLDKDVNFMTEKVNLVAEVASKDIVTEGKGRKKILVIDCGVKENIKRELLKRDCS
jgi:carbamoylphosphate synthase small subunit